MTHDPSIPSDAGGALLDDIDLSLDGALAPPAQDGTAATQEFFGNYQLIREVGRGGLGRVMLARHVHPNYADREFAVKLLHEEWAAHPLTQELFRTEAFLLSLLRHPNIVRTFEAGIEEGRPFIAMEFIHGRDFWDCIAHAKQVGLTLPLPLALHILTRALAALAYAHEQQDADGQPLKLVHRDVNPSNIFLSYNGEVKLGDFGVASVAAGQAKMEGKTVGKVGFLAPEQITNKPVDQRADIFSFGVTMYAVLCGVRPFDAPTLEESLRKNARGTVRHPSKVNPSLDPRIVAIMMRALQPKAAKRYPDARSMLNDLSPLLPPTDGMDLAVAALLRTLFLSDFTAGLKLRHGLAGPQAQGMTGKRVMVVGNPAVGLGEWPPLLDGRGFKVATCGSLEILKQAIRYELPSVLVVDSRHQRWEAEEINAVIAGAEAPVPVVLVARFLWDEPIALAHQLDAVDLILEPLASDRMLAALWAAVTGLKRAASRQAASTTLAEAPSRALLISCDTAIIGRLEQTLPGRGFEVTTAPDTVAGLALAARASFRAVILDVAGAPSEAVVRFAADLRAAPGMGLVPFLFLTTADHRSRFTGVPRSAVRPRQELPVVLATTLKRLCAEVGEGRTFVRYPARFAVDLRLGGRRVVAEAVNISRDGAFVRCSELPPVRTEVNLHLHLPTSRSGVTVTGRVVRIDQPTGDSGDRPGLGVEFARVTSFNEADLIAYIGELAAAGE